jgi:hypothetical protein
VTHPRRGAGRTAAAVAGAAVLLLAAAPWGSAATARSGSAPRRHAAVPARPVAPLVVSSHWLNGGPPRREEVVGRPRLIVFWVMGSDACERSVPAIRELQYLYAKRGLVLLGVHAPAPPAVSDSTRVAGIARAWGLTFPIALDPDSLTARTFRNRLRPTLYVIDRKGSVRATHAGELAVETRAWKNLRESIEGVLGEKE